MSSNLPLGNQVQFANAPQSPTQVSMPSSLLNSPVATGTVSMPPDAQSTVYAPLACSTRLPISVTRQDLEALREKSVAIKTCMTMTMEEIECLIRSDSSK